MYTQVIESLPVLELPHPNPPLVKGREPDSLVFPQYIGGIKGGNLTCVYTVAALGRGLERSHTKSIELTLTIQVDIMPLQVDVMPLQVDVMPLQVDIMPLQVDIMPLQVDIMPLQVDIMPLQVDIMPLQVDIMPLQVDIMPLQVDALAMQAENSLCIHNKEGVRVRFYAGTTNFSLPASPKAA
ncbi:hypothetical protein [Nostoc sp. UHCC 0926]|uniref:hypothetical protein n=1 Tax=Nostoc sp. UHCC 0926 TaxID=3025190 RepID=UPI002362AA9C|nr:hypothetical protein [Nostoc sp. UHCC 0926]